LRTTIVALAAAAAMAAVPASAQTRHRGSSPRAGSAHARVPPSGRVTGRAVPRPSYRPIPGRYDGSRYYARPYYGRPYYGGSHFYFGFGYPYYSYWYPYSYAYGYPAYGYGYPGYYYPPAYSYGYGYGPSYPAYGGYVGVSPDDVDGGVRIQVSRQDAEVYADGYYVGTVDDFDGTFQRLKLEPGAHHIEIREPGYETLAFDVRVEPGQTITYRAEMRAK
jgi:hypothetical protein